MKDYEIIQKREREKFSRAYEKLCKQYGEDKVINSLKTLEGMMCEGAIKSDTPIIYNQLN